MHTSPDLKGSHQSPPQRSVADVLVEIKWTLRKLPCLKPHFGSAFSLRPLLDNLNQLCPYALSPVCLTHEQAL